MDVHAYLSRMADSAETPADKLCERLIGLCFECRDEEVSAIYRAAIHNAHFAHLDLLRGRKETVQ